MADLIFQPGFLPYGSDDSSVIFRSSLTSLDSIQNPEVGAVTGVFELGSGVSIDPIKGLNPGVAGGYQVQGLTDNLLLDNEFQLSFEVNRDWVSFNDPVNDSIGFIPPGANSIALGLNLGASAIGKNMSGVLSGFSRGAQQNREYVDLVLDTGSIINAKVTSANKGEFVTLSIWFSGDLFGFAVDNVIIAAGLAPPGVTTGLFSNMYLGSDRGIGSFMGDNFMRNLQISTRAPSLQSHPKIAKIGILSDSLFFGDGISSPHLDALQSHQLRGSVYKTGLRPGIVYVDVNNGFTAETTGALDISSRVPALLAENPTTVMISMATNDALGGFVIDAAWDADVKSGVLDPIIADDKVELIIVGTVTSFLGEAAADTPASRILIDQANTFIKAWTSYSNKIKVVDRFNVLGGHNPSQNYYVGQLNTLFNDIHYAPKGQSAIGRAYAEVLLSNI